MAARKKASRRGSGAVAKKAKATTGSASSRKRKAGAAASARTSRAAAKGKSARTAKAKPAVKPGKSEAARLRAAKATKLASAAKSASAAKRAASAKRRALATKAQKAVELKLNASQIAAKEAAKTAAAKLATTKPAPAKRASAKPVVAAKPVLTAKPAAAPVRPLGGAAAKAPAAPLVKAPSAPFAKGPLGKRAPVVPVTSEFDSAAKSVKPAVPRHGFKVNEFVVYPAHGVGQIISVEEQEVAGFRLELFVISFVKDKMMLRVPTSKVVGVGMRKLSEPDAARRALEILTGRARIKRTMWSRRAQEYEAKINSGDINAIAEVVRDLYRSEAQPEQSYSERQLYEAALDRMIREIAAVQKLSEIDAMKLIESHLRKSQRRLVKSDAPEGEDATVEEAA
jgi:CarD family transcriptional regulator, regulator of rRNA transcription